MFSFNFDNFFQSMRRSIRQLGINSQWYNQLKVFLSILSVKTQKLNWLYSQLFLDTSTDQGLLAWGVRYGIERKPLENDEDYRRRLIIERDLRIASSLSLSLKASILAIIAGIQKSQVSITTVYSSKDGKSTFRMGGKLGQHNMTRKYMLYRYLISLPALALNANRSALLKAALQMNYAGNIPEFREDQGAVDWFAMGGSVSSPLASRRSEINRKIRVY